jgi:hypothetical protein
MIWIMFFASALAAGSGWNDYCQAVLPEECFLCVFSGIPVVYAARVILHALVSPPVCIQRSMDIWY